jgi:anti-sigma factor RsiW
MNNSNIDNLLNSFIDGELDTREQVKIKRMISHDYQMARRLQQLKNLKALLGSLPKQEAPADTMQHVKALWERDSLLGDFSYQELRIHSLRHRVLRRVRAAAAMIGLVTVLFVLVYSIVSSPPGEESTMPTHPLSDAAGDPKGMGAGMIKRPFEGKLELHCSSLSEVDHYIRRAIEDHGFTAVRDEETFKDISYWL